METKKDCPYKKRQFSPCFVKSTSSPLGAMCSQETGAWCGGKEHGTFSSKIPATLMMQRDILSVQTAWQLDPLQGLSVKVWEIKKKKNGYGNILLNEYNKDSRRSKEGRDLQEEIERNKAKTDFRFKWEGKKTRKAYITGERPEMPQKTSRVEMDLAENRRRKTHQQRHSCLQSSDDGEKAGDDAQWTNGQETKYRKWE